MHLAQQGVSRLTGTVLEENITGEKAFWDQVGVADLIEKTGHNTDTPIIEVPHARRMVVVRDYERGVLIDQQDRVRMLINPDSEYAKAFAQGVGRNKDDTIIAAATADALTGKDGTTTTTFAAANIVAVDYVESGAAANSNLTVAKVREANRILNANEVEESERYAVISSDQLAALQRDDEFTSRDYNVLQPLMSGQLPTIDWMGFSWRRSERLLYVAGSTTIRRCLFYHKNGIKVGTAKSPMFRIDERPDKSYATQVYVAVSWGATRMEEVRVVDVRTDEST